GLFSSGSITDAAGTSVAVTNNATIIGSSISLSDSLGDALHVGGNALFAAGPISIGGLGTVTLGSLTFHASGAASIHQDSDMVLSGSNFATSAVLSSTGSITDAPATGLAVTNNASLSGTSINVGNSAGDSVNVGSLTFNSPGAVNISEDSATVLSGTSTAGSLTLISGDTITNAPNTSVTVATTADLTGTSITLADHATDVLSVGTGASFLATTGT